jgi:hypothetical protein
LTIILCLDDKNSIAFNKRRQSRDKVLIENVMTHENIYIMEHSAALFTDYDVSKIDNISELPADAVYFHEITDPKNIIDVFDTVIIYRWNRHYPSDVRFELTMNDYKKIYEEEFVGFSHDKITKEVYERR